MFHWLILNFSFLDFIIELPETKPILWTERDRYEVGDVLRANCSAAPSKPRVELRYTLNNMGVSSHFFYILICTCRNFYLLNNNINGNHSEGNRIEKLQTRYYSHSKSYQFSIFLLIFDLIVTNKCKRNLNERKKLIRFNKH